MKHLISVVLATAFMAVSTLAQAEPILFRANLNSAQEVNSSGEVISDEAGTGWALFQLNDLGGGDFSLSIHAVFDAVFNFINVDAGLDNGGLETVVALHFHDAPRGTTASPKFGLFGPNNDEDGDTIFELADDGKTIITGEWDLNEGRAGKTLADFVTELQNAAIGQDVGLYFNLHTADFPSGAIRGQLVRVPVPASGLLLIVGLVGFAWRRKKLSA